MKTIHKIYTYFRFEKATTETEKKEDEIQDAPNVVEDKVDIKINVR